MVVHLKLIFFFFFFFFKYFTTVFLTLFSVGCLMNEKDWVWSYSYFKSLPCLLCLKFFFFFSKIRYSFKKCLMWPCLQCGYVLNGKSKVRERNYFQVWAKHQPHQWTCDSVGLRKTTSSLSTVELNNLRRTSICTWRWHFLPYPLSRLWSEQSLP